jgi:hypothetical protein
VASTACIGQQSANLRTSYLVAKFQPALQEPGDLNALLNGLVVHCQVHLSDHELQFGEYLLELVVGVWVVAGRRLPAQVTEEQRVLAYPLDRLPRLEPGSNRSAHLYYEISKGQRPVPIDISLLCADGERRQSLDPPFGFILRRRDEVGLAQEVVVGGVCFVGEKAMHLRVRWGATGSRRRTNLSKTAAMATTSCVSAMNDRW